MVGIRDTFNCLLNAIKPYDAYSALKVYDNFKNYEAKFKPLDNQLADELKGLSHDIDVFKSLANLV